MNTRLIQFAVVHVLEWHQLTEKKNFLVIIGRMVSI